MTASHPTNAARLQAKTDFLVEAHVWPISADLNCAGWLRNFRPEELPYAFELLDSFMYFSPELMNQMMVTAFRRLLQHVCPPESSPEYAEWNWRHFQRDVLISRVAGANTNDADSGYLFIRRARQQLGISDQQIVDVSSALSALRKNPSQQLVFFDDFVGTGQQFTEHWETERVIDTGERTSFREEAQGRMYPLYYCPLICTQVGSVIIRAQCENLVIVPANVINDAYEVFSDTSSVWPASLRETVARTLERITRREPFGVDWQGFAGQALLLAFQHGVPDNTFKMMHHESDTWTPLVRRT